MSVVLSFHIQSLLLLLRNIMSSSSGRLLHELVLLCTTKGQFEFLPLFYSHSIFCWMCTYSLICFCLFFVYLLLGITLFFTISLSFTLNAGYYNLSSCILQTQGTRILKRVSGVQLKCLYSCTIFFAFNFFLLFFLNQVTVLMDEQQVEVESVGEDGEMDGAIKGILRAAAGEMGQLERRWLRRKVRGLLMKGMGKRDTRGWTTQLILASGAPCGCTIERLARSREPCACSAWRRSSTEVAQVTLSDIYSISIPMISHNSRVTHKSGLANAKSEDPGHLASSPTVASGTPTRSHIVSAKARYLYSLQYQPRQIFRYCLHLPLLNVFVVHFVWKDFEPLLL